MSEYTHEDFEKIERIQEQDENVTSTSMSDDIAEQFDRYEESGDNDAQDIINDFRQDDTNESSGGEPLISFGVTETTAKHTTPAGVHDLLVDEVARKADPVCCSEGCFMKSVDPRDPGVSGLILKSAMEGADGTVPAEPGAHAESCAPARGDSTTKSVTSELADHKNCIEDSDSLESSSGGSYSSSSSDADSEAESSSSDKSDNKGELFVSEESNISKMEMELDKAKSVTKTLEHEDLGGSDEDYLGELSPGMHYSAIATAELSDEPQEQEMSYSEHQAEVLEQNNGSLEAGADEVLPTVMLGESSGVRVSGLSAEDMDDIMDKLMMDEDIQDSSPVVSDTEREIPVIEEDNLTSESDSESSGDASLDSDISNDDLENANWSSSPLHKGGYSFGHDESEGSGEGEGEEEMDADEDNETECVLLGYKYKSEVEDETEQVSKTDQLRQDVQGPMAEIDTLVKSENVHMESSLPVAVKAHIVDKGEAIPLKIPVVIEEDIPVDDNGVETIEIVTEPGAARQLIAATSKVSHAHDLLHVTFQSPTNTIFYDPESPVIERVSVEEANELIDEDEEAKDIDREKDMASAGESKTPLEAAVVQDLKEVYENLEARAEIEGALELLQESGLKNVNELAQKMTEDVLRRNKAAAAAKLNENLQQEELIDESDDDDDRRGSMIVHDVSEDDSKSIVAVLRAEKDTDDNMNRESVSSMVIHDDVENENLEAVCMSEDDELLEEARTEDIHGDIVGNFDVKSEVDEIQKQKEDIQVGVAENDESKFNEHDDESSFNNSLNETVIEVKVGEGVEKRADQIVKEMISEVLSSKEIFEPKTALDEPHCEPEVAVDLEHETNASVYNNDAFEEENTKQNALLQAERQDNAFNQSAIAEDALEKLSTLPFENKHSEKMIESNDLESEKTLEVDIRHVETKDDFSDNKKQVNDAYVNDEATVPKDHEEHIMAAASCISDNYVADILRQAVKEANQLGAVKESGLDKPNVELMIASENKQEQVTPDITTDLDAEDIAKEVLVKEGMATSQVENNAREVLEKEEQVVKEATEHLLSSMLVCEDTSPFGYHYDKQVAKDVIIPNTENKVRDLSLFDGTLSEDLKQPTHLDSVEESHDDVSSTTPASPGVLVSEAIHATVQEVLDLIYWRDVKTTGVVFGCMMFVLLSLACFSLLSVVAYLSLAILTITFSFRVYKNVMQAVQKTNEGNPFKKWLDFDLELKEDIVKSAAEKIAANINNCSRELRRLYLVVDYIDSLKFGLLLWLLTYVGSWFNGMTLIILALVFIFTLPKVYETYQGPIDQNINLVRAQLNKIMAQVSEKIPFPKKKAKAQ